jgi:hypothetical protein
MHRLFVFDVRDTEDLTITGRTSGQTVGGRLGRNVGSSSSLSHGPRRLAGGRAPATEVVGMPPVNVHPTMGGL